MHKLRFPQCVLFSCIHFVLRTVNGSRRTQFLHLFWWECFLTLFGRQWLNARKDRKRCGWTTTKIQFIVGVKLLIIGKTSTSIQVVVRTVGISLTVSECKHKFCSGVTQNKLALFLLAIIDVQQPSSGVASTEILWSMNTELKLQMRAVVH